MKPKFKGISITSIPYHYQNTNTPSYLMAAVASTTRQLRSSSEYEDAVSWEHVEDTNTLVRQTTIDRLSDAFAELSIGSDIEREFRKNPWNMANAAVSEPSNNSSIHSSIITPPTIKITPPDSGEKVSAAFVKPKL